MSVADIKKTMQGKMEQSIASLKTNLAKIRTGRANPAILDTVHVEYYGGMVPLSQVANVSSLDARTLSVQAWEKGMSQKIEKAIRDSDLGLNLVAHIMDIFYHLKGRTILHWHYFLFPVWLHTKNIE